MELTELKNQSLNVVRHPAVHRVALATAVIGGLGVMIESSIGPLQDAPTISNQGSEPTAQTPQNPQTPGRTIRRPSSSVDAQANVSQGRVYITTLTGEELAFTDPSEPSRVGPDTYFDKTMAEMTDAELQDFIRNNKIYEVAWGTRARRALVHPAQSLAQLQADKLIGDRFGMAFNAGGGAVGWEAFSAVNGPTNEAGRVLSKEELLYTITFEQPVASTRISSLAMISFTDIFMDLQNNFKTNSAAFAEYLRKVCKNPFTKKVPPTPEVPATPEPTPTATKEIPTRPFSTPTVPVVGKTPEAPKPKEDTIVVCVGINQYKEMFPQDALKLAQSKGYGGSTDLSNKLTWSAIWQHLFNYCQAPATPTAEPAPTDEPDKPKKDNPPGDKPKDNPPGDKPPVPTATAGPAATPTSPPAQRPTEQALPTNTAGPAPSATPDRGPKPSPTVFHIGTPTAGPAATPTSPPAQRPTEQALPTNTPGAAPSATPNPGPKPSPTVFHMGTPSPEATATPKPAAPTPTDAPAQRPKDTAVPTNTPGQAPAPTAVPAQPKPSPTVFHIGN